MPTGYTSDVSNGKVTTLRDFALHCARAFGALITMRDDPMNASIPQELEPDTKYHDEHIAEAAKVLDTLPSLSPQECDVLADDEFKVSMANHTKYASKRALTKQFYNNMLQKVKDWTPDPELSGLQKFMIDQLQRSIEFDCAENYQPKPPIRLTGERWREKALERASNDLAYHTIEREKEIQLTTDRNKWLKALWNSLPPK